METTQDKMNMLLEALIDAEEFVNSIENYNDDAKAVHETIKEAIKNAKN